MGGEIIKLDPSPNSTHVNVFEMAGIDPKKVEENTKLINDLINSIKSKQSTTPILKYGRGTLLRFYRKCKIFNRP